MRALYLLAAAALVLLGCSGRVEDDAEHPAADAGADSTAATGEDASAAGEVGCLFCADASEDVPDWLRVRGKIDQICSQRDCHGSAAGGLGLSPGHEFATLVDVPSTEMPAILRVRPGDPARSYAYLKIACDGGITGACMPEYADFDPDLVRLFHDWIEAGAPTQ